MKTIGPLAMSDYAMEPGASLPGTIRKQRATIEKLTRENRKMKVGHRISS